MHNNYLLTKDGNFVTIDDSELTHANHKYVKREKVNGKWRYWYDVGEAGYIDGWTGKKPSRLKSYSKLEDMLGKDEYERFNRAAARVALAEDNYHNTRNSDNRTLAVQTKAKYTIEGKNFTEACDAFMKTPMGKVYKTKSAAKKAKNKVGKFLERVGKNMQTSLTRGEKSV